MAKDRVITAELSSEWLTFMVRQPFWCDYLKRTIPRQFARIDEVFMPAMEKLFERESKPSSADYLTQMDAIKLKREQAEEAVLKRLTNDAIRLVDLGICAMPEV